MPSAIYFVLLLGGLILVHELGHFLMAKAMGVKVLVFSIGFGPALLKWRRGDTEYRLAAVPLGGFVKMFGDEVGEEFPRQSAAGEAGAAAAESRGETSGQQASGQEPAAGDAVGGDAAQKIYGVTAGRFVIVEADKAFNNKPVWRRTLIVLAGPAANLVLPFIVFFGMLLTHTELVPSYIGGVEEGGPAWQAGIRPGDTVESIDGERVDYWWQMERRVNEGAGRSLSMTVRRGDGTFTTGVVPEEVKTLRHGQIGLEEKSGRMMVTSQALDPVIWVRAGSPAAAAGLSTFDRVRTVDSKRVRFLSDALSALALPGEHVVEVMREEPYGFLGHAVMSLYTGRHTVRLSGPVAESDVTAAELSIHEVDKESAAAALGLTPGCRLVSVDGRKFILWTLMEGYFAENVEKPIAVAWVEPDGTPRKGVLKLVPETIKGEFNEDRTVVRFGAFGHATVGSPDLVENRELFAYASHMAWEGARDAFRVTVAGLVGLIVGKVPLKEMGGPILIYSMASKTETEGWDYFFFVMAWLSINLGIINLLPIPILDGGHLFFFAIEAVIRRPVPVKVRQGAAWVGLLMILGLMVLVFYNDIMRNWSAILNWF